MGAQTGAVMVPYPSARPGSASFADAYGSSFGPRTATAGSEGAAKAAGANSAGSPITIHGIGPDFLKQPAGGLIILVLALVALRFVDRGAGA